MDKSLHEPKSSFPFTNSCSRLEELRVDNYRVKTEFFRLYPISDNFGVPGIYTVCDGELNRLEICIAIWLCGAIAFSHFEGYGSPDIAWKYICGLTGFADVQLEGKEGAK